MKEKNLNGTTGKKCPCGSWTNHWDAHANVRSWPQACGTKDCTNPPDVGAHVKRVGSKDHRHYIAMLCHSCNLRLGQTLELEPYVKLVWANVRQTCGAT